MDLERIYREQYRSLVEFIHRRLRDRGRAEELAQEVFVRAIGARPRRPRSWLYAVASNLVRDEGRHRAVRDRHLRLVRDTTTGSEPATAEARLQRQEARARVRAALERLTERDRRALLLKEDGADYEMIADELGLSRGSVGTTLARARRRLAAAWADLDPERGQHDAAR